jgi:hypothetical protein
LIADKNYAADSSALFFFASFESGRNFLESSMELKTRFIR